MQYSIMVFNKDNLGQFTGESLLHAITESNYETLCNQYGLDLSLIEPAISDLEVVGAKNNDLPLFVVKYGESYNRSVVVQQWHADAGGGKKMLQDLIKGITLAPLKSHLRRTHGIIEITLAPVQLKDMGLLLAYEIARWAADRGNGIVYGLDGAWYRLNQTKAFIPISSAGK